MNWLVVLTLVLHCFITIHRRAASVCESSHLPAEPEWQQASVKTVLHSCRHHVRWCKELQARDKHWWNMINAAASHSPAPVMHHIYNSFLWHLFRFLYNGGKTARVRWDRAIFFPLCWDAECRHNAVPVVVVCANSIQHVYLGERPIPSFFILLFLPHAWKGSEALSLCSSGNKTPRQCLKGTEHVVRSKPNQVIKCIYR